MLKYAQLLVLLLCVTSYGLAKEEDADIDIPDDESFDDLLEDEAILREIEAQHTVKKVF